MASLTARLLKACIPRSGVVAQDRAWIVPDGRRVYAVGDVHGRLDLLRDLTGQIACDDAARAPAQTTIVFLGDLVDRGPDSCGVVEFLMNFAEQVPDCVLLGGNHDDVFVRAVDGEHEAVSLLHRIGGRETALSYGIAADEYDRGTFADLGVLLKERVPRAHVAFLRSFNEWHRIGDYLFVHAGIRPGVAMGEQRPSDLRWIRRGFLDHAECHGMMIVHGHTVTDEPEFKTNRIGIDTGAFKSGKLTAVGLESTGRWLLST